MEKIFATGTPVSGKNFIDRKKHLPLFEAYIKHSQSFMIKAPRRFGKTSIVKHLLENNKNYNYMYIDVKIASNLESLSNKIIDKAYALSGIDNFLKSSKESLLSVLKKVQKIKIDDIAEITLSYQEKEIDEVEYFLHSLEVVEKIAIKKNIEIKFVLDEFQDILSIAKKDILDKMRSVIQHHTKITYIFLGSIESMMRDIFEHKSSPFFHFAQIVELPPLDTKELYSYAIDIFDKQGVSIDKLKEVIEFLKGHPDYTMQYLQKLYFIAIAYNKKSISVDENYNVFIEVLQNNKAYIDELISKAKQRKHHLGVLINIAKDKKSNIEPKTLYNVKNSLEEMGLIKNISLGKYKIVDIFLELYLQQEDSEQIEILQLINVLQKEKIF